MGRRPDDNHIHQGDSIMMGTIIHVLAEIFFISAGIFAIWAIHATLKGK
jgi:uncharacterized membrane protein